MYFHRRQLQLAGMLALRSEVDACRARGRQAMVLCSKAEAMQLQARIVVSAAR